MPVMTIAAGGLKLSTRSLCLQRLYTIQLVPHAVLSHQLTSSIRFAVFIRSQSIPHRNKCGLHPFMIEKPHQIILLSLI